MRAGICNIQLLFFSPLQNVLTFKLHIKQLGKREGKHEGKHACCKA